MNRRRARHLFTGLLAFVAVGCGQSTAPGGDDFSVVLDMGKRDMPKPPDQAGADLSGRLPDLSSTGTDAKMGGDAACLNTSVSCGNPGACTDCTGAVVGGACVMNACGCNTSTDCPLGSACDPAKHTCSVSCVNNLTCNGGCCDGAKCVSGTNNTACGTNGGACNACGLGTPTCVAGACAATCVPQGMAGGVCGTGFCCSANNSCQAIGNTSCGTAGAVCADCTMSMKGALCLQNGTCGCTTQANCPMGQACTAGVCGTACSVNEPCNGGCCNNGMCAPGSASAICAVTASAPLCATCVGNVRGVACVTSMNMTFCGCNTGTDCPVGNACNTTTHLCAAACDMNSPCNGGCCSAAVNGTCVGGTALGACGANGGVCSDCTVNNNGHLCQPVNGGGQCGCINIGNCAVGATACTNSLCSYACDTNVKCPSGCCSAAVNGTCQPGTTQMACGIPMSLCADCAIDPNGSVCRPPGACGCNKETDCAMGQSCNLATHQCSASCGGGFTVCNGGCCAGNMCVTGTSNDACGTMPMCLNCTNAGAGHVCIAGACGCNVSADCGPLRACDVAQHLCVTACNQNQPCNKGCCNAGTCVAGTANLQCGSDGLACTGCKNGTPTCTAGACTANCGANGNGVCDGGNCCNAGMCVAGTGQGACGYSGTCTNCAGLSQGSKCVAPNGGPYFCGCTVKADCPPASGILAGETCDMVGNNCTSLCGAVGLTACNGGCCSGPGGMCQAGNQDTACGVSGGYCNDCTNSCNQGQHCNANNGSCGCANNGDCPGGGGGCGLKTECAVTQSRCCEGTARACANGTVCCSGTCAGNLCACIPNGQSCLGNGALCCSFNCVAGLCAP